MTSPLRRKLQITAQILGNTPVRTAASLLLFGILAGVTLAQYTGTSPGRTSSQNQPEASWTSSPATAPQRAIASPPSSGDARPAAFPSTAGLAGQYSAKPVLDGSRLKPLFGMPNTPKPVHFQPAEGPTNATRGEPDYAGGQVPVASTPPQPKKVLQFGKETTNSLSEYQPAAYQPAAGNPALTRGTELSDYEKEIEIPGNDRLFRLESEASWQQRMRQQSLNKTSPPDPNPFPDEPVVSKDVYAGRHWPTLHTLVEPNYVTYGRMYFEEINAERYGWDLGLFHPAVSAGTFFAHLAMVPYRFFSEPCRCYEANAGYCLPGDPTALMLYPEGASAKGALGTIGTVIGLIAIFP